MPRLTDLVPKVTPGPDETFDVAPGPQGFSGTKKPKLADLGGGSKPSLADLGGSAPRSGRTSFGVNQGDQGGPPPPKKPPLPSKPAVLPAPARRGR